MGGSNTESRLRHRAILLLKLVQGFVLDKLENPSFFSVPQDFYGEILDDKANFVTTQGAEVFSLTQHFCATGPGTVKFTLAKAEVYNLNSYITSRFSFETNL